MKKALQLSLIAALASPAWAVESSKPAADWSVYGGFGFNRDLLHFNVESPTPYGNVYLRAGQFVKGNNVAGQVGFRKAYSYTEGDQTGYYVGAYVGHVRTVKVGDKRENVLGVGGEMSYLWQNSRRLNAFTLGLALSDATKLSDGSQLDHEPFFAVGYTIQAPLWHPKAKGQ